MRKIDIVFRHNDIIPADLSNQLVVVIDVLRATSVITTALAHGAREVITVAQVEEAFQLREENPQYLLAGERNAIRVEGFDFGNSPLQMTHEAVEGRSLVLCTSNGTQSVAAAHQAKKVIAASFLNMKAVEEFVLTAEEDLTIVCSGTNRKFSLDDSLAAAILVNRLKLKMDFDLTDSAHFLSLALPDETKLREAIMPCFHLNLLLSKGFDKDVDYCLTLDALNVVPKLIQGRFVI